MPYKKVNIMSRKFEILNHLTPAIVTTVEANIAAAKIISDPLIIKMTGAEIRGLLKIGVNRTGEMDDIFIKLLKPFPQTIPTGYTLSDYESLQQERSNSLLMAALYQAQANAYTSHANAVGNNLFLMHVEGLDIGRQLMKTNPGIAIVVNEITADYFPHSTSADSTIYTLTPGMVLEISNLITGKRIVNIGTTVLTMLVKGGGTPSTITIYPGDSAIVPGEWTNVTMTNLSATTPGKFLVFLR